MRHWTYRDCGAVYDGRALHGSAGKLRLRNALPDAATNVPDASLMQNRRNGHNDTT